MSTEPTYETQRIDHLGIVAGVCQEISLIEQIDGQVKASERKISCGKGTQAMILNALGFVGRAMYLTPDYFDNKPVDVLIGPGVSVVDFTDDTLARCLDDLYETGVNEVFYKVATNAMQVYGIQSKFVHLDSSSFHLHGAYDRQEEDQEAITITYGYSKDHRPDLKQVVVQLITSYKSALPVWFEALSGNSNDKKTFTETVKAYCKQLKAGEQSYVVMDSAGFSEATIQAAGEQNVRWLMRVPETLAQAKALVRNTQATDLREIEPGYQGKETECEYAGFKQRWLMVFSEAAQARELKTLEKAQAKEMEAAQKAWRKIEAQTFNCRADAEQAVAQFNNKWKYHQVSETAKRTGGSRPKWVAVVAHTSAKFGTGWQPAVVWCKIRDPLTGKVVDACACPSCGKVVMIEKDGFVIPVTDLNELAEKRQFCRNHVPGWELDPDGRIKLDANGDPVWGSHACKTPLFEFAGARRHSIADYIAKHAQGKFKLLIADESHQFKSKSSDRGVAFHQLVTACRWTLTLTGTFFGWKSTSIFWLLHRLNHGVRRDFSFHDEKRWARLYGVLESTRRRRRDDDANEDGVYTGNRRYRNQAREQPGVSPAIVSRLLDTTIFLSLKDLNLALPTYKEEVVALDMLNDQGQQYHGMNSFLKQLAVQSNRYMSTWLQWSLARPNSAFRDEVVMVDEVDDGDGKSIRKVPLMELPAIVPQEISTGKPNGHKWLPKENWLADVCKLEKQQGRKVLIYVRQTGTRDIQDRVQMPLQANGLRVSILSGNVNPRKREEWIDRRVNTIDALICNPKLVETGLDLVQFSTVVFYEIEYSLYTLWQSVRRVWRLGQTQPVKAIFSVYNSAMEATALALMGKKMKAAQLVYGDEVGGAIVPEEEGDFLTQLARDVLDGAKLSDLQTLFADDLQVSHNPMGSLTIPSAAILPGPKVMTWDEWMV